MGYPNYFWHSFSLMMYFATKSLKILEKLYVFWHRIVFQNLQKTVIFGHIKKPFFSKNSFSLKLFS